MRTQWRMPTALSALVALLMSAGCGLFDNKEEPESISTVEVTAEAGVYTLEGVTFKVPEKTVAAPTKLTVTAPVQQSGNKSRPFSGFNSPSVEFDISLAGGIQPREPIGVEILLTGRFLPQDATAEHALLYSPNKAGQWRLVPSVVEGGVLRTKLTSLSPKHIAFVPPLKSFREAFRLRPETVYPAMFPTAPANTPQRQARSCWMEAAGRETRRAPYTPVSWSKEASLG